MSIPIYKAELDIADKVRANASIAYSVSVDKWEVNENFDNIIKKAVAALSQQHVAMASQFDKDLYFSKSLFVTTNWNANDDVFDRIEVWNARHTPSHKPTNIEHDEKLIVGHMTDVWAVDGSYNLIADDSFIDDLPSIYHLVNGSVIYRAWSDGELAGRAEKLITEIESGKMYVSMEVLFNDFSYAVVTPNKELRIVARNEETSFLTKHLRAYGGSGSFDNCRLGRIVRNLTFSGKGYTKTPANPFSVILNDNNMYFDFSKASAKNPFSKETGVSISLSSDILNTERNLMSDNNTFVETENKELKQTVAELSKTIDELKQSQSKANVESLESKAAHLQSQIDALNSELTSSKAAVTTLTSQKGEVEAKLVEITSAKAELETKLAKVEAEKLVATRVAKLVDGGVDKVVAEQKVAKFSNLSDEQFDAVAEDIVKAAFPFESEDDKKKKKEKEKAAADAAQAAADATADPAATNANTTTLNNVTPETTAALSTAASVLGEDLEKTRSSLRDLFAARLGREVKSGS